MVKIWLQTLEKQLESNPPNRHQQGIDTIAEHILQQHQAGLACNLNFICTHNSRRSQFAQTWSVFAQAYLGIDVVKSFSGGTEVTACNPRTVQALQRTGLSVKSEGDLNPVYTIKDQILGTETRLWSKVYDDDHNPSDHFIAVMTCDHADKNCPFIPGAKMRIPLTYKDPKYADDTEQEKAAYDLACSHIATDMLRIFKQVKANIT